MEGLAELHTHLGGSVSSDILWSLAHRQGIALPVKDFWDFDRLVTVSDPRGVPDLDALMCANDLLALGALDVLRAAGRRVPQDVAVVGMDDTDLAAASWPSLTSVSLGSAERGKAAAELLLDRLQHGEREPRVVTVPPRLVVRSSTTGEEEGGT